MEIPTRKNDLIALHEQWKFRVPLTMEDFGVSNIVDDDGNDLSGGVMSKNLLTMKRIKFVL